MRLYFVLTVGFCFVSFTTTAALEVTPAQGEPGDRLIVRGDVARATNGFRLFWDQNGVMQTLGTAPPSEDSSFEVTVNVPQSASSGRARIGVAAERSLDLPSLWVDFDVLPPSPASISGVMLDANGLPVAVGTPVRLRDHRGDVLTEVLTEDDGQFQFFGLLAGIYIVEPLADNYPPQTANVSAGGLQNVNFVAIDPGSIQIPLVYLMRAGALALPGGSYTGTQPVHVGDWTDQPFTRLVSLRDKGRPPLNVRFYAELKRGLLETNAPIAVYFALRRADGTLANSHITLTPTVVYPASPHNFTAFTWDVNSLELPPGKLTLEVKAYTTLLAIVGDWSFPVEVVGLGDRWFSGWVKNPELEVKQKNFYELRHTYKATLPKIPGVGTPLFDKSFDVFSETIENRFDLGVQVKETISTYGMWSADAKAKASLILFDLDLSGPFATSKAFVPSGQTLPTCTYNLPLWTVPLPAAVSIPVYGGGLSSPIDLCGMSFSGHLGVFLELSGDVSLASTIQKDLLLTAQLTPGLNIALPAKAGLEVGVCEGSASVTPKATVAAPIIVDPAANPPVDWAGLCVTLSGNVSASLSCCELFSANPSIDLFDPIYIGSCPSAKPLGAADVLDEAGQAPPVTASIAVGPLGYAVAVWDNVVQVGGAPQRTAPLCSVFDGTTWSDPAPIAGDEFAGWEPHVAFIGPAQVMVTWVHYRPSDPSVSGTGAKALAPAGLCDTIKGILCGGLGLVSDVVGAVGSLFDWAPAKGASLGAASVGIAWQAPQPVLRDDTFDLRPALAGNPESGEAVLVWLREQEVLPGQRPLALYTATYGSSGWSAPARLDTTSAAMDIQPSVRFDRTGTPAVAWIRDEDANLATTEDRRLLYSMRGRSGWLTPETIAGPQDSPWTPSLDFDAANQAVVAFVIPPYDQRNQRHWPGDGLLGSIAYARQSEPGTWAIIGGQQRGERPILRIRPNNMATVLFRSFGSRATGAGRGEIAAAVADLETDLPDWHVAPLTRNGQINWRLAGDVDAETGAPIALWETRDAFDSNAPPVIARERRDFLLDLSFSSQGLTFSNFYANPGENMEITAQLVNLGLSPFRNSSVEVHFFDSAPGPEVMPFATVIYQGSLDSTPSPANAVKALYPVRDRSRHTFYAVLDPGNVVVESDESNNLTRGNAGGVPPPEGLTVAPLPRSNGMQLSWSSAIGDGSVRHWIWRASADGPWELLGSTTANEFTDTSAVADMEYRYRLTSVDDSEESDVVISGRVAVPPVDPDSVAQDLRLHIFSYGGGMHLMWNSLPGVRLETSERLGSGERWGPPAGEVREIGGAASFSHPPEPGNRFYRLAW